MINKEKNINEAVNYLIYKRMVANQEDLAKKMDITKESVSRALNGNKKYLTDKFILRFYATFNDIFNENWLLTGRGEMLKKDDNGNVVIGENLTGVQFGNNYQRGDNSKIVQGSEVYNNESAKEVEIMLLNQEIGHLKKTIEELKKTNENLNKRLDDREQVIQSLLSKL